MKIWIHLDGRRCGPYTLDSLPADRIKRDTPVWYEGLAYWVVAADAPLLAHLWSPEYAKDMEPVDDNQHPAPPVQPEEAVPPTPPIPPTPLTPPVHHQPPTPPVQPVPPVAPVCPGQYMPNASMKDPAPAQMSEQGGVSDAPPVPQSTEACPPSYLVWSVLFTVLCCNPVGIVPIILGSSVKTKYMNFDYEGARRQSENTAMWLMVTIVTSFIMFPLSLVLSL